MKMVITDAQVQRVVDRITGADIEAALDKIYAAGKNVPFRVYKFHPVARREHDGGAGLHAAGGGRKSSQGDPLL